MGKLTNLSPATPITDEQIPQSIARDTEYTAADAAHISAVDPHLQYATQARGDARYVRYFNSFEEHIPPPISFAANTWKEIGSARVVGEQGKGSTWLINVYFQYVAPDGSNQPYFQYCGAGQIGVIHWQADLLVNQGIEIPFEAHYEADFTARMRFGRGQSRKLEMAFSRDIVINSPGFGKISGLRLQ